MRPNDAENPVERGQKEPPKNAVGGFSVELNEFIDGAPPRDERMIVFDDSIWRAAPGNTGARSVSRPAAGFAVIQAGRLGK
jgi:hypothetical protein